MEEGNEVSIGGDMEEDKLGSKEARNKNNKGEI
jgi:hypothetical protein